MIQREEVFVEKPAENKGALGLRALFRARLLPFEKSL